MFHIYYVFCNGFIGTRAPLLSYFEEMLCNPEFCMGATASSSAASLLAHM